MTKNEEYLIIYSDMLENVIFAKMGATDGSAIIQKISESAQKMCLSDKVKELISQCKQN